MIVEIEDMNESELRLVAKNALKLIDDLYEDIARLREQNRLLLLRLEGKPINGGEQ